MQCQESRFQKHKMAPRYVTDQFSNCNSKKSVKSFEFENFYAHDNLRLFVCVELLVGLSQRSLFNLYYSLSYLNKFLKTEVAIFEFFHSGLSLAQLW